MSTLILLGSARRKGNTYRAATQLQEELKADIVDLLDLNFGPFRYDQTYPADDQFLAFIEEKLLQYDHIVFASPVYWYSMSSLMKQFFDRLSDLLKSRKELGRQLRGKTMSVISSSSDEEVFPSFFLPFELSAAYLGMAYAVAWHTWVDDVGQLHMKQIQR